MADVTLWPYRPDGAVLERLQWRTDVIPSYEAGEQRIALLSAPRRSFEWQFALIGAERRRGENLLHQWQAQEWGAPVWMDVQALAAGLSSGATAVPCDTTTRDFHAGGLLAMVGATGASEVLEIDSVADDEITLAEPTTADWPAGTEVVPVRLARMPDQVALRRFTGDVSYGAVQFDCTDVSTWPAATGGTAYRSLPVLEDPPNWTEDPDGIYTRKVARLDSGTGPVYYDEEGAGSVPLQSHRWLLDGRAQIDAFRRWLYARQGRLSAFWMPTFAQDLAVVAAIGAADTTIDVEHCGYTAHVAQAINRRDVRILLGGAAYHRRITDSEEVSATVERLTIDAAIGADVDPGEIVAVSYMAPVRLDADAVEISWWRHDVAEAKLRARGSMNDI